MAAAAILAADVAGYSRLMGADEEGTLAHLKSFKKTLVDPKIVEHHGRIVKTTGAAVAIRGQADVRGHRGSQKYSGKDVANSHGSLPIFA